MTPTPRPLTSVPEAVALVLGSTSEFGKLFAGERLVPVWFRGHADGRWPLEPGVFRRSAGGGYLYDEYQMLAEMALMHPLENQKYPTTFDWLVMCQHYGLPTRLLDWTESILVGLFFAVQSQEADGALYVLEPSRLNTHATLSKRRSLCLPTYPDAILRADQSVSASLAEVIGRLNDRFGRTPFHGEYLKKLGGEARMRQIANLPVAVYPPRNNARIVSQCGMFTVHGGTVPSVTHRSDYGEAVSLEGMTGKDPSILTRFEIPSANKGQIREDLARLGIHHGALFPEFDEQARHLREKWSRRPRVEPQSRTGELE